MNYSRGPTCPRRGSVGCWMVESVAAKELVRTVICLRKLRPSGPVKFIVTPGAFVLTRVPIWKRAGWTRWEPRYVTRLNLHLSEGLRGCKEADFT